MAKPRRKYRFVVDVTFDERISYEEAKRELEKPIRAGTFGESYGVTKTNVRNFERTADAYTRSLFMF